MVYLDHAATTDLRSESAQAWVAASQLTANPASLHRSGRSSRRLIEESRERIAAALGVAPSALVFTSGGTESDNLAVIGTVAARRLADPAQRLIVLPRLEHKAVLEPAVALGEDAVVWWEADSSGHLDPKDLESLLAEHAGEVALVCLMAVNNEVGAIEPVAAAGRVCARFEVPLHTDAVQALGVVPLDLADVATAAFSAHKVGGPMGVGVLYASAAASMTPLVRGGGHESGLRSGTLNVPGIAAAAVAIEAAVQQRAQHVDHQARLRERLLAGLSPDLDYRLNSDGAGVPGIVNVSFAGCESDALMMLLDAAGVAVSTGSACTVGIPQPSHVLLAMGRSPVEARSALRISTGRTSAEADIDALLAALPEAVSRARRAGMVSTAGASR